MTDLHALCCRRESLNQNINIGNVCFVTNEDMTTCKLAGFEHATGLGMRTSRATHCSGTAPFMACEVLDKDLEGNVHRPLHDFEVSSVHVCMACIRFLSQ